MPASLRVALTRSAEEFAARAGALLAAGPQTNLHATVLGAIRSDPSGRPDALFATVEDRGEVVALALRSPPRPLIASEMEEAAAADLVEAWLREDAGLPGVVAPAPAASHIAAAWERLRGGKATLATAEAAHRLERVLAPERPAPGALRAGRESDRALLVRWSIDFAREAEVDYGDAERIVDRRLAAGGLLVWEHGGPVSMVGVNDEVAGVVRLGPVYTPPEHRGRGYATSAVAAASEAALARGAHACMLFTDLANPTSNRIYAAVGYERFADWREYRFAAV
ncbi:MAG TPA: GNAT family N-acetyltransferase [Solirubrobacteraceae bacterium]|nr:GNAT family N-acetyltransferase [Solirubrobacteraceae bacterium]